MDKLFQIPKSADENYYDGSNGKMLLYMKPIFLLGFPFFLIMLIPMRKILLPRLFSPKELGELDKVRKVYKYCLSSIAILTNFCHLFLIY